MERNEAEKKIKDSCQLWHDPISTVRVMGIVEGYVILRRGHGQPFVRSAKQFINTFQEGKKP